MIDPNTLKKPDDDDIESEEHLWEGGYSGKAMIGSWALAAVLSVALIGGGVFFGPPGWMIGGGAAVLLWLFFAGQLVVRKLSVHYELTTQRFIHKAGILSRRTDRIELIDVDDVTFVQGIIQRIVNVGSIKIVSSDRTHPELTLRGIDDVENVSNMIDDARRRERRRRGLHIETI